MIDHAAMGQIRRVIVTAVDHGAMTALCTDISTSNEFSAPLVTHGFDRPRPGDAWQMKREMGQWIFDYLLGAQGDVHGFTTAEEAVGELAARGLVPYVPRRTLSAAIEVPYWAAIGERRVFENKPSDRWLRCNGALVLRPRWPLLFEEIGTRYSAGDGVTTFGVPNISDPDAGGFAHWYILAE